MDGGSGAVALFRAGGRGARQRADRLLALAHDPDLAQHLPVDIGERLGRGEQALQTRWTVGQRGAQPFQQAATHGAGRRHRHR